MHFRAHTQTKKKPLLYPGLIAGGLGYTETWMDTTKHITPCDVFDDKFSGIVNMSDNGVLNLTRIVF